MLKDDVQDGSNNTVENHMVFATIHCMKKITDLLFVMVLFLYLFWDSYPSIKHALSRPLLARSDDTIISYYSHKNSYFRKTFLQKNEAICGKTQLDGWTKFTKKRYLWSVVYKHKKQPLSKVSACFRCSLPS